LFWFIKVPFFQFKLTFLLDQFPLHFSMPAPFGTSSNPFFCRTPQQAQTHAHVFGLKAKAGGLGRGCKYVIDMYVGFVWLV
jgi:hypothetical protein